MAWHPTQGKLSHLTVLWIHYDPDQDKAATWEEWMNELLQSLQADAK